MEQNVSSLNILLRNIFCIFFKMQFELMECRCISKRILEGGLVVSGSDVVQSAALADLRAYYC